jgi:hypothetical protein
LMRLAVARAPSAALLPATRPTSSQLGCICMCGAGKGAAGLCGVLMQLMDGLPAGAESDEGAIAPLATRRDTVTAASALRWRKERGWQVAGRWTVD